MLHLNQYAVIAGIAFLAAYTGLSAQEQQPKDSNNPSVMSTAPAVSLVHSDSVSSDKKFRPGDAVRLFVYPDTMSFLNGIYVIDDNGSIRLPFDGSVAISDMNEKQLTDYLTQRYVKYLLYPQVHVRHLVRLSVIGGFQSPGMYYVDPALSTWEAVRLAGVPLREDGFKLIRLVRGKKVINAHIASGLKQGLSLREMGIESGDVLSVTNRPKRGFGEIFQTNVFPWISVSATLLGVAITAYQFNELLKQ